MTELTDAQIETQEVLLQGVFNLVNEVIENQGASPLEWDIEWIGEIADMVVTTIELNTDLAEMDVYPYFEIPLSDDPTALFE